MIDSENLPLVLREAGMVKEHMDKLNARCIDTDGVARGPLAKSYNFLENIQSLRYGSLSDKQREWLDSVVEGMVNSTGVPKAEYQETVIEGNTFHPDGDSGIKVGSEIDYRLLIQGLVDTIKSDAIRQFTNDVLAKVPLKSWTGKASRSHHLPDERGDNGNALHTIRVARAAMALCDICDMGETRRDMLLSAAILHDSFRYGKEAESDYTLTEHPMLIREVVEDNDIVSPYAEDILGLIECHMGKWGPEPFIPIVHPSALIHIADAMIARLDSIL